MFPGGHKSIFGQEMRNSNFRLKMDHVGQKSIFGQKIASSNLRLKFAQKWCLEVSNRFLVKKLKVQFFDQNRPKMCFRGPKSILVEN